MSYLRISRQQVREAGISITKLSPRRVKLYYVYDKDRNIGRVLAADNKSAIFRATGLYGFNKFDKIEER